VWGFTDRRTGGATSRLGLSRRLRRAAETLGPTYIKLGQIISSGEGLFPPELVAEFKLCRDQVPAEPFDTVRRVVETDLGGGRFQLDFSFTGRSLIFPFIPGEVPFFRAAGLPDLFVTKGPFRQTTVIDVSGIDETTPPPVVGFTIDVPNRVEDLCDDIT